MVRSLQLTASTVVENKMTKTVSTKTTVENYSSHKTTMHLATRAKLLCTGEFPTSLISIVLVVVGHVYSESEYVWSENFNLGTLPPLPPVTTKPYAASVDVKPQRRSDHVG